MEKTDRSFSNALHGTLLVTGVGSVQAKPDVADIDLGVVTDGKTAQEAMQKNAALMGRVVGQLKERGVPPEDLQTRELSVSPVVDNDERSATRGQIIGYRVNDTLHVRALLGDAAALIDAGMEAGANQVSGLSLGLRNPSPHQQKALEEAVRAAQRDAERSAYLLGVALRGPQTSEVSYGEAPSLRMSDRLEKAAGTPLEGGTLTIRATARVSFVYSVADIPHHQSPAAPIVARIGELFIVRMKHDHPERLSWKLVEDLMASPVVLVHSGFARAPESRGGVWTYTFKASGAGTCALRFQLIEACGSPPIREEVSFQVFV